MHTSERAPCHTPPGRYTSKHSQILNHSPAVPVFAALFSGKSAPSNGRASWMASTVRHASTPPPPYIAQLYTAVQYRLSGRNTRITYAPGYLVAW
jgi:hypothetical protein